VAIRNSTRKVVSQTIKVSRQYHGECVFGYVERRDLTYIDEPSSSINLCSYNETVHTIRPLQEEDSVERQGRYEAAAA